MERISWRLILVLAVLVTAVIYILPSINPGWWPYKTINKGLDLQGGMHLVLNVETEKAVENNIERISQELRAGMRKEKIRYQSVKIVGKNAIEVTLAGEKHTTAFKPFIDDQFNGVIFASENMVEEVLTTVISLPDEEIERIKKMAVDQALETIRNRIDQFGVAEPDIRRQGETGILVQLPGIKDTQRAKDLIGKTALLEFKIVDDSMDPYVAAKGTPPAGSEVLYQQPKNPETTQIKKTPFLLKKRTLLTGAALTDARVAIDSQYNEPYVSIEFDKKGGRAFERITGENIKKRLAIVLDNKVYSAPVIQDKISGGAAQITGRFTMEEARDLAIILRAGALPAPVTIMEERTVGPSLGHDSIRMGMISMLVGGLFVVLFMMMYYKLAGVVADIALAANILIIGAGLAMFGATLTLPGIAGIILTIGMAVDANVLIFERIREEIALGKSARAALATGFERASLTILDANVTTLIAALVLFQFGTGPVKGFAVTLCLGVLSSLFTSLILSRMIFEFFMANPKIKNLSI